MGESKPFPLLNRSYFWQRQLAYLLECLKKRNARTYHLEKKIMRMTHLVCVPVFWCICSPQHVIKLIDMS